MSIVCKECCTDIDDSNRTDQDEMCNRCLEPEVPETQYVNIQIAKDIRKTFSIYAFNCSCKGEHPDCAAAINNTYNIAQMDTVRRICDWLEKQK